MRQFAEFAPRKPTFQGPIRRYGAKTTPTISLDELWALPPSEPCLLRETSPGWATVAPAKKGGGSARLAILPRMAEMKIRFLRGSHL